MKARQCKNSGDIRLNYYLQSLIKSFITGILLNNFIHNNLIFY